MKPPKILLTILFILVQFCLTPDIYANNLSVANISLTGKNAASDYVQVQFDLSWENSWRDDVNHDGVWIFIKFRVGAGDWTHATIAATGHSLPGGDSLLVGNTGSTGKGAFIYRAASGSGNVSYSSVQLRWSYGLDGVNDNDLVTVKVFGVEMVYVPRGQFYLGDVNANNAYNNFYTYGTDGPYQITSESAITVGTSSGNLYYAADVSGGGDQSGPIPVDFPKGYDSFWSMKYEITQGQYTDFLNTLTRSQQNTRTETDVSTDAITNIYVMTNSQTVSQKNNIVCPSSGNGTFYPVTFSCSTPDYAANYLSADDVAAYLDWAALRPITELEFEKACRGQGAVVQDEFAWGSTTYGEITGFVGTDGSGTETKSPTTGTVNLNFVAGNISGPVRVGIFAASANGGSYTRENAGASYWGIMELSGNVSEMTVTVGTSYGRGFAGEPGDGALDGNGDANSTSWSVYAYGNRGGAYNYASNSSISVAEVSSRADAAYGVGSGNSTRDVGYGGRGGR